MELLYLASTVRIHEIKYCQDFGELHNLIHFV